MPIQIIVRQGRTLTGRRCAVGGLLQYTASVGSVVTVTWRCDSVTMFVLHSIFVAEF